MSDYSAASTPKVRNQNAMQVLIESHEINLKYLCEIKQKVVYIRELLAGSQPTLAGADGASKSSDPNGMVERIGFLNRCVDVTQHEIMDDLVTIEKALIG